VAGSLKSWSTSTRLRSGSRALPSRRSVKGCKYPWLGACSRVETSVSIRTFFRTTLMSFSDVGGYDAHRAHRESRSRGAEDCR
jgi:hypothetical protein